MDFLGGLALALCSEVQIQPGPQRAGFPDLGTLTIGMGHLFVVGCPMHYKMFRGTLVSTH